MGTQNTDFNIITNPITTRAATVNTLDEGRNDGKQELSSMIVKGTSPRAGKKEHSKSVIYEIDQ